MTGYFRISNEEKLIKHDHLIFYFESRLLIFNDIRKFGFIKFYKPQEVFSSSHLSTIGPEPFSKKYDFDYFKNHSKKKLILKSSDESKFCCWVRKYLLLRDLV